jgi:AraC family transcriptional regulator
MIIRELPNPNLFDNSPRENFQNEVICASSKGKYHYPTHITPYLIVANFKGSGNYQVNSIQVSTNDRLFYFLNSGDSLEIDFKHSTGLETLLILFSQKFILNWINYKYTAVDSLVENGAAKNGYHLDIPNIPFEFNANMIDHLNKLKSVAQREEADSILLELLDSFWIIKEQSGHDISKIKAKRKSTREEIYRRLLLAKTFIHENYTASPTVDKIAAEACLDKFHFLKLFKYYHGITPHRYLVKLKLEHAHFLLATGQYTVLEVCQKIGFESQGSFTNLFKKYYRTTPSELIGIQK